MSLRCTNRTRYNSWRRIARELNLDRKTVPRYLRATAKSSTISNPAEPSGAGLVTAALEAEAGRGA